jgi:hypothetical protein
VVLFVRSWYKKYAPNAQTNSLERRLFFQWLSDNSNPTLLDGEKVEWLDAAWNAVWEKCADISLKSSQKLQDQPKTS